MLLHRIQMNFNMLYNCTKFRIQKFAINKRKGDSFRDENKFKKFKSCLTKQVLNMFKLWCEHGALDYYHYKRINFYNWKPQRRFYK